MQISFYSPRALLFYSLIILLLIPLLKPSGYTLHILIMCFIWGIVAASWDLLSGYAGQLSFGHAGFFGLGAYSAALLTLIFDISPWLSLLFAGVFTGIIGLLIGFPCLRVRGPYLALVTLAFSETIRVIFHNWDLAGGPLGLFGYPSFPWVPHTKTSYYYLALFLLGMSFFIMHRILNNSRIGLAFRSMREDEMLAQSVGVNVTRYKLLSFFLSTFFTGVAGAFYAYYILLIDPYLLVVSTQALIVSMVILGGIGTLLGPIIGAFVMEILSEYLRAVGVIFNLILVGSLVVVVLIFFPRGIMGFIYEKLGVRY